MVDNVPTLSQLLGAVHPPLLHRYSVQFLNARILAGLDLKLVGGSVKLGFPLPLYEPEPQPKGRMSVAEHSSFIRCRAPTSLS